MKTAIGAEDGDEFMGCHEAVDIILQHASRITLLGDSVDVVTRAAHELIRNGSCDSRLIEQLEQVIRACLDSWTAGQKRSIWRSAAARQEDELARDEEQFADELCAQFIDGALQAELLNLVTQRLSGDKPR